MANHSLPTLSSTYVNFVAELNERFLDVSRNFSTNSPLATNIPVNTIRWNATTLQDEIFNGTTWSPKSVRYAINIDGTVGATAPSTGAFTTLSSNSTTALAAGTTVGGVAVVTTAGTQTLTNKTLTLPVISTISNSGTVTLPTGTRTLVATDTTDTLTNKTLTAPRIANGGFIADVNGNEQLRFVTTASAVNEVTVDNSATGVAPSLYATGGDTNINLNLAGKGTGTVTIGGVAAVTTTSTQTLTNKTLTLPVISTISNSGTVTLPTGTRTLVATDTTDTLTNKTLTAPRIANGGFIADANGNEQLRFVTTASAVNEVTVDNSATGVAPSLYATGGDTNINLNLAGKGTGTVTIGGLPVATTTGTQTLTNKTWNGALIGVPYGGTGASTNDAARTNLDVPSRSGADASGTWNISVLGNAATVTNGVYDTGDQTIAGIKTFTSPIVSALTGNASTATTLQTTRAINGTNFNGSAAITTANWGTARTLNGVSVNGSTNYNIPTIRGTNGTTTFSTTGVTSAVNYLSTTNSISTQAVSLNTEGTDTDIGLNIITKGAGAITLDTSPGAGQIDLKPGSSSVRFWDDDSSHYYQLVTGNRTANYSINLPEGNVTIPAGTLVPTTGTGATGNWNINATNVTGTVAIANGGTGGGTAAAARTNLGLVIGTDVPSTTGTGASGSWGISITGNAATATNVSQFGGQVPSYYQQALGFTPVQQSGGTYMNTNKVYVGWDSGLGETRLQIDATQMGVIVTNKSAVNAAASGTLYAPGTAPLYACRAWVNFNGTGAVAIRASGNVSSITDNGTGNYTVNFTTAMPNAFSVVAAGKRAEDDAYGINDVHVLARSGSNSTARIYGNYGGNAVDMVVVSVAVFC